MVAIPSLAIFANVAVAQPQAQADKIPVKLQVVISTFEGDRKVSSIPYTLLATANGGQVTFLNGTNVPIQISGDGKITYTNIGTNITCTVTTEAGNFKIAINFDEKSVTAAKTPAAAAGTPTKPLGTPDVSRCELRRHHHHKGWRNQATDFRTGQRHWGGHQG